MSYGRLGIYNVEPELILVQTKIGTQIDPLNILVASEEEDEEEEIEEPVCNVKKDKSITFYS